MKKTGLGLLAVLIAMMGVNLALAQDGVSAEKTALVKELIEVTGGKQSFDEIMTSVLASQKEQTKSMMDSIFVEDKTLSTADKAMLTKMVNESVERVFVRSQEYFTKKFDFDKFIDNEYIAIYAKHFTDDELRDLIAFYRTPTGQKTIREMPQLMAESMMALSKSVLPDFMEFIKKTIDEEMAAMKQKLPKKKPSRRS